MDVVTAVQTLLALFTALVKLGTSLALMERLVTIIMSAQRTVMVATIIATTLLVPITAGAVQAMNCHQIKRLVSISMSACVTLTTVLRYVETPQDRSHVVVTLGMHCLAADIVTILTNVPAVMVDVLTLVLTMPVHSYAAVILVTIYQRMENHVLIPTNVQRIMEGVDTIAQILWDPSAVHVVAATICL